MKMDKQEKREKSMWPRCAYGMADIYGGGAFVIIGTFFTVFLTKSLGMSTALAGTIPLIGKVWDAVTDPLMGNICDRTSSRFGAKRFYILIGSIVSAVTFVLMWVVFPGSTTAGQYLFYMLMYMLFSTGFTIVMVPYNALLPDMVEDYTVRSKFSGVRMIFSSFGAILAGLIPTLLIKDNTDASAYITVALIFGVIFFAVVLLTFFGTWERQKEVVKIGFAQSFVQSLTVYKSRSFRLFIAIFLFGQGAADFVTGLAVYYVDDVLNAYGGGRFTYLMAVILLSQFVGTILFTPIMAKTSKRFPILLGFPVRIAATLAMLFFSHEGANFTVILALTFVIGLGMAGSSTSIYAILADMADVDELITSINRPGTCSAMATFVRKIAGGLSSAIIGVLLALAGYDEVIAAAGGRQSAATQRGVAYIYIFVPILLMILTLVFTVLFPINEKEFGIIKREIARRKGEDTSIAAPEEIAVCEKVTGYSYDRLWSRENALKLSV
ncbi:MAG: MFS transporter [Roseburia sp.]|nr:MFS transporter [Roseburia sp.]MCM1097522.1 MFS transporter [Ruminococcus flavefaciens]